MENNLSGIEIQKYLENAIKTNSGMRELFNINPHFHYFYYAINKLNCESLVEFVISLIKDNEIYKNKYMDLKLNFDNKVNEELLKRQK